MPRKKGSDVVFEQKINTWFKCGVNYMEIHAVYLCVVCLNRCMMLYDVM